MSEENDDPVWRAAMNAPMVDKLKRKERRLIRRLHREGVRTSGREIARMMRVSRRLRNGRHSWATDQGLAVFARPCAEPTIGQRVVFGRAPNLETAIVLRGLAHTPGVVWARDSRGRLHSFPKGYKLRVCG
jgi:hypothetical protein